MTITSQLESTDTVPRTEQLRHVDRIFAILMPFQYVAAILTALTVSPLVKGADGLSAHPYLTTAAVTGGLIAIPFSLYVLLRPNNENNGYFAAIGQMLMGSLLIHVSGGRIEAHFHVFISLAFLAFYRDWTILLTATVVVAANHFARTFGLPNPGNAVNPDSLATALEHCAWILFEDVVLVFLILQNVRWSLPERTARLPKAAKIVRPKKRFFAARAKRVLSAAKAVSARMAETALEAIQACSDGILSIDASGKIISVNPAGESVFGVGDSELLGTAFGDRLAGDGESLAGNEAELTGSLWKALAAEANDSLGRREVDMVRADGETFSAELTLTASKGKEGGYTAFVRDTSGRRFAEQERIQAQTNRLVSQVLAGINEEVAEPASALDENILTLRESFDALTDIVENYRVALNLATNREDVRSAVGTDVETNLPLLLQRIPEALEVSRLSAARVRAAVQTAVEEPAAAEESRRPVDMNRVVYQVLGRMEWSGNASFDYDLEKDLPPVFAEEAEVSQALQDLMSNAVDAVKERYPDGSGHVQISTSSNRFREVSVRVEDDGVGIAPELLPRIFQPSFTTKKGSAGQGLAHALAVMKRHGGRIASGSEPGKGSAFEMRFPRPPSS